MVNLLIVESPAKAKTINKYLGNDYKVLASMGHVRSLVPKDGSVDTDNNFEMKFEILNKSSKAIKDLVDVAKTSDKIILAPDPDREGEAIAWHVLEVLKIKKAIKSNTKVERITFNEITKDSVNKAIKSPRNIDIDLVQAQQARQALDYLVGFNLSPVLWRKLPGSKSAGRVQSVALRLICDREEEIEKFNREEYWTINVDFDNKLTANLTHINGKKLEKLSIKNKEQADEIKEILNGKKFKVTKIEKKQTKRNPYPPFITSTLQQEASRKLGFSAKQTMSVAQKLYENGHITYMRTDGVYTAPEAIKTARDFILKKYGEKYLPEKQIVYQNKSKNAQEAHEAIRPSHPEIENIEGTLYEQKLYSLIWKRLIASQMESVILDQIGINIETETNYGVLRAVGTTINFDGFYILYNINKDEDEKENEDDEKHLPKVNEGEYLNLKQIKNEQHFTEPPPRYNEASLVKKMEELGIGRPSTYATIISVIQEREYVKLDKKKFLPESRGRIVTVFLKKFFSKYVQYDYTASLENDLDKVANKEENWILFLDNFWKPFKINIDKIMEIKINEIMEDIKDDLSFLFAKDESGNIQNSCPKCGGKLQLRFGKFGAFMACSNYPECKYIQNLNTLQFGDAESNEEKFETKLLGQLENDNVYLKKGPYGFYIQKGENSSGTGKNKIKPKQVGIPKTETEPSSFSFEKAKPLLSLPRILGEYENDKVVANLGRFGPYIQNNKVFYSIKKDYDVLTIDLKSAINIIEEGKIKKKEKNSDNTESKKTPRKRIKSTKIVKTTKVVKRKTSKTTTKKTKQ